ncbi:MAG: hypothetical protein HQL06_13285 [Nitrospirae bacterium]|nr:hypothetical protein [Nitrospirota bacterium]
MASDIVSRHVGLVPVQAPSHPTKDELSPAVAVSVTTESAGKEAEHVKPQFIPEGELITVPMPVPVLEMSRLIDSGRGG